MLSSARLEREVLLSWERCIKKEIPSQLSSPRRIFQKQTPQLNDDNVLLISIFEKEIKGINHFISTNHLFLLADPDGNLLAATGSKMLLQILKTSGIGTGISFFEESCGTNAIALAMRLKRSIFLFPEQHYCSFFKKWYCYVIPLDVGGEIKGYLDISTIEQVMKRELIAITGLLAEKIVNDYIWLSKPIVPATSFIKDFPDICFNKKERVLFVRSPAITA